MVDQKLCSYVVSVPALAAKPEGQRNPGDSTQELEAGERLCRDARGLMVVGEKHDAYDQRDNSNEAEKT